MLIVLEGIDGTGKTTVANMLHSKIPNSILTKTPGGESTLGPPIRKLLLDKNTLPATSQALLFMADMLNTQENIIKPAINNNLTVICDRFFMSTYIYQLKNPEVHRALRLNFNAKDLFITPDYTFIFDIPIKEAQARLTQGRDRYESNDLHIWEDRRANYLAQSSNPNTHLLNVLDQTPEQITKTILERIKC